MTAAGRRRHGTLVILYLVLLVTSTIVRQSMSQPIRREAMRAVSLPEVNENSATAGRIKLAYVDTDPGSASLPGCDFAGEVRVPGLHFDHHHWGSALESFVCACKMSALSRAGNGNAS
jgi:hypothetical protein